MTRQKAKGKKRPKNWHRGRVAGEIQAKKLRRLPETGIEVDYGAAAPKPFPRRHPPKGDAL